MWGWAVRFGDPLRDSGREKKERKREEDMGRWDRRERESVTRRSRGKLRPEGERTGDHADGKAKEGGKEMEGTEEMSTQEGGTKEWT